MELIKDYGESFKSAIKSLLKCRNKRDLSHRELMSLIFS